MFKKVLILTAILSIFSTCTVQAAVIDSNWIGGGQGEWGNANNWDPAIVPDNGANTFVVTIDAGAGEVEIGLRQRRTISQLDCFGVVELAVWPHDWQNSPVILTVVDVNGLTNYGELEFYSDNRQFEINGDVTNTAGAELVLEGAEINGNFYNAAGAVVEVEIENDTGGDFENAGILIIIHASDLLIDGNAHNTGLVNLYDGELGIDQILDNNSTGLIKGFGLIYANQMLQNKGTICAYGGCLAISSEGTIVNQGTLSNYPVSSLHIKSPANVNNYGNIEVNSGGIAFDCDLVNEQDGVINLVGGNLAAANIIQTADANFAGFGTITANVEIETGGKISLTGPTNIIGDVNIPAGATLEISDGQTLITGHTICDGTIHLIGGTVIFQGGCDCADCNITHEPGADRNHFDINADGIENLEDFASFTENWLWQASWY